MVPDYEMAALSKKLYDGYIWTIYYIKDLLTHHIPHSPSHV